MIRTMFLLAFVAGAAAVMGMSYVFLGTDALALSVTLIIGLVYGIGSIELVQFHQATKSLQLALNNVPSFDTDQSNASNALSGWLDKIHSSLRYSVMARIEGESKGLPSPVLTPYLVGLLVMLGLLGTFLGMVDTLQGSVLALQGSTELSAMREGLTAPIQGLGAAFGTSVAGVAASAMLGLMSTLGRRERIFVVRDLDVKINTLFRTFSLNFNRQETYKALQQQAKALPELANQIAGMTDSLQKMSDQLAKDLNAKQDKFHESVGESYQALAESVSKSLNSVVQNSADVVVSQMRPAVSTILEALSERLNRQVEILNATLVEKNSAIMTDLSASLKNHNQSSQEAWTAGLAAHEQIQQTAVAQVKESLGKFSEQVAEQSSQLIKTLFDISKNDHEQWQIEAQKRYELQHESLISLSDQQAKNWQESSSAILAQSNALSESLRESVASQISAQLNIKTLLTETAQTVQNSTLENTARLNTQLEEIHAATARSLKSRDDIELTWHKQHQELMTSISGEFSIQLNALREQEAIRSEKALQKMSELETRVAQQLADLGQSLEEPLARLIETASEAPKAAAELISRLKTEMTQTMERDNNLLEERRKIMADLDGLSDSLAQSTISQGKAMETLLSSTGDMLSGISERFDARVELETSKLSSIAQQFAESGLEIASIGDAFLGAVGLFSETNEKLVTHLDSLEQALETATTRNDEQLAYYVAQAREIIDHSMMTQKGLIEEINQMALKRSQQSSEMLGA